MAGVGKVFPNGTTPGQPVSEEKRGGVKARPARASAKAYRTDDAGFTSRLRAAALNRVLTRLNVRLRFRLAEGRGAPRILLVDKETGEVIREIPPDYFLGAGKGPAEKLSATGLLVDEGV